MISFGDIIIGASLPTFITEASTRFQWEVHEKKNAKLFSLKFTDPPEFYSQTSLWVLGLLEKDDLSFSWLLGDSAALGDKGAHPHPGFPSNSWETHPVSQRMCTVLPSSLLAMRSRKGWCRVGVFSGVPKNPMPISSLVLICGVMTCFCHLPPPLALRKQ